MASPADNIRQIWECRNAKIWEIERLLVAAVVPKINPFDNQGKLRSPRNEMSCHNAGPT
jgi:hypothetical protein